VTFANKTQRIAHTRAEKDLHKLLTLEPLSVPVKTQAREGRCRLDFFFPDWKLAVELDGPWHDADADKRRDDGLAQIGITVLRLPAEMPPAQLRRHIAYVSQRILYLPLAEKVHFARNYEPAILDNLERPPQQQGRTAPRENCLDCGGTGWKQIPVWSAFLQRAEQRATRCACANLRDESQLTLVGQDAPLTRKPAAQVALFAPV
jgi:very-short-patch-repair endonuclease